VSVRRLVVDLPGQGYPIHLGPGVLVLSGGLLPASRPGQLAAVIADETTAALYADGLAAGLRDGGWEPSLSTISPGESSKTLATAERLYGALADAGADRGSTVFALGGGVVGDLAGFVAATYMRGIDFVTVPTTLLAQVDSSVGGKVGVDLPRAKNLVGAFHQPTAVLVDTLTLGTLPERQFSAGMAEVVKHAAIADGRLFEELTRSAAAVRAREPGLLTEIVARNCEIKASVVVQDPQERTGARAVLNYGHTLGHALERGAASWGVLHGEAVAVGMIGEAQVAARRGLSAPELPERLRRLLAALGAPTRLSSEQIDLDAARRALAADKKIRGGALLLPVVPSLGHVELTEAIAPAELADELEGLLA